MTREIEDVQRDIDQATGNAWLNQEERVWGLAALKEELDVAEKDAGTQVAGDRTEAGMRVPAQGVLKKKKKKKLKGGEISRLLERTKGTDVADRLAKGAKKAMPATAAEAAKGGRKSKRGKAGEKKVVVTVGKSKLTKLKTKLRQPTPDEELATGIPPNEKGKKKKGKKRFNGPLKGGFYPSKKPKGPATKAAAGMAGMHVVGASGSKRGGDAVKPSGITKPRLKKAIRTLRKKKSGMGSGSSGAGMHVVG